MEKHVIGQRGQSVSGEYVFMIALVLLAILAMTTYVRRAIQGRYRDANRAVYTHASAALGNVVEAEYEPYYVNTSSDVDSFTFDEQKVAPGGAMKKTGIFERSVDSDSVQKPF